MVLPIKNAYPYRLTLILEPLRGCFLDARALPDLGGVLFQLRRLAQQLRTGTDLIKVLSMR